MKTFSNFSPCPQMRNMSANMSAKVSHKIFKAILITILIDTKESFIPFYSIIVYQTNALIWMIFGMH